MDRPRFLSGYELVAKGLNKIEASLPVIGLKDVTRNGTWLEQKQIQSSLEARKQVIEVERIEKKGQLSQAEWRDDLKLAEVIKKAGPHWQFLGHNVGKHLYLRPEEALYLIESNCLLLKHNEVTMSLQKAFSLLLGPTTSLIQYKVYASLSRIGYRIIRHTGPDINKTKDKHNDNFVNDTEMTDICKDITVKENYSEENSNIIKQSIDDIVDTVMKSVENSENNMPTIDDKKGMIVNEEMNEKKSINVKEKVNGDKANELVDNEANKKALSGAVSEVGDVEMGEETENCKSNRVTEANFTIDEDGVIRILNKTQEEIEFELCNSLQKNSTEITRKNAKAKAVRIPISSYQQKLQKLKSRKLKPLDQKVIEENFSSIPNIYRKKVVTINVPDEKLLPRNVFLNNTTYVINLDQVRLPIKGSSSRSSSTPPIVDEPSSSLQSIRESFADSVEQVSDAPQFVNNTFRQEFSREQFSPYSVWRPRHEFSRVQYSPYSAWRPRLHSNFYHPYNNMFIPRPFLSVPGFFINPRCRLHAPLIVNPINQLSVLNANNSRSNSANRLAICNNRGAIRLNRDQSRFKTASLRALHKLVLHHKLLTQLTPNACVDPLIMVISHYNSKFNERLRLSNNFELINEPPPVVLIELDEEETNPSKRRRLNEEGNTFDRNINAIKGLACKLKELNMKKQCASRHRRALSNVIKKFNKSFNADIYLNKDCEIIDRSFVTLESSSDSDSNKKIKRKRKLRNPFNILKRLKDKAEGAGSSKDNVGTETDDKSEETVLKHFQKNWVPNDDDFGRPEICTNNHTYSRIIESREDELLYEFLKESRKSYSNWAELKSSFYENLEASTIAIKSQQIDIMTRDFMMDFDSKIKPILFNEDCSDMRTVLDKIRIIRTNKDVSNDTNLTIDFDVYNRNVQNFKKTNLPNPHFRIICLDESSDFPSAAEVECLLAKYNDNIPLVFAIVGFGSSISYLQIKPSDLNIYVPKDLGE